jgi:hypothetical protein
VTVSGRRRCSTVSRGGDGARKSGHVDIDEVKRGSLSRPRASLRGGENLG